MPRRIIGFLSTVSLLLLMATLALWIRSYWATDRLSWERLTGEDLELGEIPDEMPVHVTNVRGVIMAERTDSHMSGASGPPGTWVLVWATTDALDSWGDAEGFWNRLGFEYANLTEDGLIGPRGHAVMVPHWFIAVLLAVLPGARLVRAHRRRRRASRGLCRRCGYDLRATPGRCPECGAVADNAAPPAQSAA